MDSPKSPALLLIAFLCISTCAPALGCGRCSQPKGKPVIPTLLPVSVPPVTVPPVVKPLLPQVSPFIFPPVVKPLLPPVTVPSVVKPLLPPVSSLLNPPATGGKPCPPSSPPGSAATCPIDTLKLGACVDLLGGLVQIGLSDPAVNKCCPLLKGLVEVEAAACLCTTLKLKALNLNVYVPVALQLLVTCGKNPPPGYTCFL